MFAPTSSRNCSTAKYRIKNMLSMVQTIASQTLRDITERGPVESFEQRLVVLSAAHDVLVQKSWTDADLRTIAEAVTETVGFSDSVHLTGPPVTLGPRAALSFSLVMPELMTNACKYGALCREGGRVDVNWSIVDDDKDQILTVRWREQGGPPVVAPTRRGFGSKLVRLGLVSAGGADSITGGSLTRTSANAVWGRTGTPLSAPDIAWRRQV